MWIIRQNHRAGGFDMRRSDAIYDRWYLRMFAAVVLVLCGSCSVRYAWLDATGGGTVPVTTQMLCFLLTAAAVLYFIRPRTGHHTLLGLTALVLVAKAPDGPPEAAAFWLLVSVLLALPYAARMIQRPLVKRS
jgi:hypothetical protein